MIVQVVRQVQRGVLRASVRRPLVLKRVYGDTDKVLPSTGGIADGMRASVDVFNHAAVMGLHHDGSVRSWDDTRPVSKAWHKR